MWFIHVIQLILSRSLMSAPLRSLFLATDGKTSSEIGLHMENCKISSHECHFRLEIGFLNTGILAPVQASAHGLLS